jgi:hypothetical protein
MMIGALSFLRICWILFQRWGSPKPDCCDENEVPPRMLNGVPPATPSVGLGLLSSSSPDAERLAAGAGQDYDQSLNGHRSLAMRYLVAYLPWLSQFQFWKNPKGHRELQSSPEVHGRNYRDSPLTEMRTSYKPVGDDDVDRRNVPNSTDTSPMIDMKSPTSVASSPIMNFRG